MVFIRAGLVKGKSDRENNHGLFTYYVLQALEGKADRNQDRKVTVIEVGPYLKDEVSKVSAGRQRPIIRNFGQNMVMSGVK